MAGRRAAPSQSRNGRGGVAAARRPRAALIDKGRAGAEPFAKMRDAHLVTRGGGIYRQQILPGVVARMTGAAVGQSRAGGVNGRRPFFGRVLRLQETDQAAQPRRKTLSPECAPRRPGKLYMAVGIDDAGNKGHVSQIADFRSGGDIQNAVTQQHGAVVQSAQRSGQGFPAAGGAFFCQRINCPGPEGHGIR